MKQPPAMIWHSFRLLSREPTRRGVRVVVEIGAGDVRSVVLPRSGRHVRIAGDTVSVREWLALRTGLVRPWRGMREERRQACLTDTN